MQSVRPTRPQARKAASVDLDVGVIYSGERDYMTPLVTSLAGSADGVSMRLVLVDNASSDGVARWTDGPRPAKVVTNSRPQGYAANLNRILGASDARYALLLNTDMYFDPAEQCLAKMVKFMDERPMCGISICQVHHPDGTPAHPARAFPTWRVIAARRLGLRRLFARSLGEYFYEDRDPRGTFVCDWVSGCFMLVRREAIRDVGRFDERYLKYFEDVDVCLRMARAGWQVMFNGQTHCYHYEQRASRQVLSRDAWMHARAYVRWLLKWGLASPVRSSREPTNVDRQVAGARRLRRDGAHEPAMAPQCDAAHEARPAPQQSS